MAKAVAARILLPALIRRGEAFELRCLLQHPMETGYRVDFDGRPVPRQIVRRVEARFRGETVWAARLSPAIATNPYLAFYLQVDGPGELLLSWQGDAGFSHQEAVQIQPQ